MYHISIQFAADKTLAPQASLLRLWAKKVLEKQMDAAELSIRIVGIEEMTALNTTYRNKKKPTNVLSFPADLPDGIQLDIPVLGDIVICAQVVNEEALPNARDAHWAHMVVHGIFHLLGHDHEIDSEAEIMEALEIENMQVLGFPNPYQTGEDITHYD